ncbi:hypothetical protein ACG7TL_000104 [Trametes sanguinea]
MDSTNHGSNALATSHSGTIIRVPWGLCYEKKQDHHPLVYEVNAIEQLLLKYELPVLNGPA